MQFGTPFKGSRNRGHSQCHYETGRETDLLRPEGQPEYFTRSLISIQAGSAWRSHRLDSPRHCAKTDGISADTAASANGPGDHMVVTAVALSSTWMDSS